MLYKTGYIFIMNHHWDSIALVAVFLLHQTYMFTIFETHRTDVLLKSILIYTLVFFCLVILFHATTEKWDQNETVSTSRLLTLKSYFSHRTGAEAEEILSQCLTKIYRKNCCQSEQVITSYNKLQQATTCHNKLQQATTSYNRQQQVITCYNRSKRLEVYMREK